MTDFGPRTRSSAYSKVTPCRTVRYINGVKDMDVSYADLAYKEVSNVMNDVVTENFKQRIRNGEIINNPCEIVDTGKLYRNTTYSWGTDTRNYYFDLSGNIGYLESIPDLPVDADIQNAINLAVTSARAKVSSAEILIGATLGELKETKDMFISAAVRLRHAGTLIHRYFDIIMDPRKNHWDKAGRLIGTARDAWMEMRFGWRPFAGEAQDFYRALRSLEQHPERQTFRAGQDVVWQGADSTSIYLYPGTSWLFDRTTYATHKIRAGVLCEQRYGGVPDTWGITKIPSTIWELTRLSWAVDYFLNIGDLIAAYTPDSLWTPMASWLTTKSKVVSVVQTTGVTTAGWSLYSTGPSRETTTITYTRSPDPTPQIAYRSIVGDTAKLIDIAALTRIDAKKWLKRATVVAKKLGRKAVKQHAK